MRLSVSVVATQLVLIGAACCQAQLPKAAPGDWPWWRGPNFNGVAEANQDLPVQWSDTKNVAWKAPVPGRGHASPIVVGNRVLLSTADESTQTQGVVCFDRKSGERLWTKVVSQGGFPRIHRKNTHASSTLACDGELVFATHYHHDALNVTALKLNGRIAWQKQAGRFEPRQYKHGYGASPLLYGNTVIVAGDYDGPSYLVALDRKTSNEVWRAERPAKCSYATPVVAPVAGRDQLLISGCEIVAGYDPRNGALLWKTPATTLATVGTPVWQGDLVFAAGGYPTAETVCIRADGSGEIVWKNNQKVYEQSMLVHDGHVYAINDSGILYCWKAETGEQMWRERLRGPISASPILAGDKIYICNERGTSWVCQVTPAGFKPLAQNQLGSEAFASPTICGNQIFLRVAGQVGGRRQEMLYCIEAAGGG